MTTLLVDGDIFIYQIASECEKPATDWGDDMWSPEVADLGEAKARFDDRMSRLLTDLDASRMVIALKDEENWRKKILPTYKAHRAGVRPPLLRAPLMAYVREAYSNGPTWAKVYSRPGLEGDDILGILATSDKIVRGEKLVVSVDKDMKSIPGSHYNPAKSDEGIVEVTEPQADYWHMRQTLTGDATDGYSGCPKVGPVKAEKLLTEAGEQAFKNPQPGVLVYDQIRAAWWNAVLAAYAKAGLGHDYALTQARVARILRVQDYDFKERKPILWTPPA